MTIRERVGNVDFSVLPLVDAVDLVLELPADLTDRGHPGIGVHFANAYNVAIARGNSHYAHLLNSADYVFSDGVPITWVGKRAYPHLAAEWQRVYGPDVMTMTLERSQPDSPRHFLLGSTPEVLERLTQRIRARFPSANIVGTESPPFAPPTNAELQARDACITASGATHVWVGLGTPKQDYEVQRLANSIPVVALAVGAAFDFLAETTPQAPRWMQRSGLEWSYRFAREPRRLAKRYLWGNSVFSLEAARTLRRASNHE
jgi:N-acetylglucosaminyldiphosphoundecaprenol N-acetyl-beta-D-mannosaminyltransferase